MKTNQADYPVRSIENLKRITELPKRFHVFGYLTHGRRPVRSTFDKQILAFFCLPALAYVVVHHVAYANVFRIRLRKAAISSRADIIPASAASYIARSQWRFALLN